MIKSVIAYYDTFLLKTVLRLTDGANKKYSRNILLNGVGLSSSAD